MPEDEGPEPDVPDQWRVYQGSSPKDAEPEPEPESSPPAARSGSKAVASLLGVIVLVTVVGVGAAIFAWAGIGGSDDPQTAEGFEGLLADLEEETGSTMAFDAVLYPEYGVVNVPYADDDRSVGYRWDGGLDEWIKGTSTYEPFDLAEVDPQVLEGLCGPVLDMMEDPGDCYIIIRQPADLGTGAWFSVYASNEFSQTGWIEFALDGTELVRHEP